MNQRYYLTILICVFISLQILNAQTFVKETATGTASGVDWDNAMGAASLEAIVEGGGTVYIAAGTYSPAARIDLLINSPHLIQGGFPASSTGTDLSGYDPNNNPTIIDGGGTIQIFYNSARVNNIHLKGLVLQNANSSDGSAFNSDFSNSNPMEFIFTDLVVQNCVAANDGTFYIISKTNSNSKISFLNCYFNNNNAANGGGIYMETVYNTPSGSSATPGNFVIDSCRFEDNATTLIGGGALYFDFSHAWTIKNTDFCTNTAIAARGGGIHFYQSGSNVLDSCFFSSNTTNEFGGGIYGSYASATITNSTFVGNSSMSNDGGAIFGSNSSWQIDATNFYDNTAGDGGAIKSTSWYTGSLRSTANNCIFSNNEAVGAGTTSGTNGGGALCIGSLVNPNGWDIDSCKFVNNKAHASSWGGAISHGLTETSITNCLFYNNTQGGLSNITGSDIKNYDNTGGFYIMSGNKMQLVNAFLYINQSGGTDASSYAFTDDTFSNADDGSIPAAPSSPCLSGFEVTGTIFEDINYGGGDGRDFAEADLDATTSGWSTGATGINNVSVELYDNTGVFIADTVTNVEGQYTFLNVDNGSYSIRVVNNTVSSNRPSNSTGATIIPVQTFRTDGIIDEEDEVGGANPSLPDTTTNTAFSNLSTLTSTTAVVQSITSITVADAALTGIDFGFNFDAIVNINDSGQGSLRQFILNSNELANTDLNQENNPSGGESVDKPADWETSLFMIPTSGVHVFQPLTQLPDIEDPGTHLTGYTQQDADQGAIQSRTITVELYGNTTAFDGLVLTGDSLQISGLSVHGFRRGIYSSLSGTEETFIWGNYVGMESDGNTPSSNDASGVHLYQSINSFVGTNADNVNDANEGNLISKSDYGVQLVGTENVLVAGNYIGTDKTGMVDQGNAFGGISAGYASLPNYIGFKDGQSNTDPNQFRNIISGNDINGILITNIDSLQVSGNYIGADVLGTGAMFNTSNAIQISGNSNANVIGTNSNGIDDVVERNIIVGATGLMFISTASGSDNIVAGNYIGTDNTGTASLSGNTGINISGTFTNTIIGTNADNVNDDVEYNVISGHLYDGVRINSSSNVIVAGNLIGIAANWFSPLGNQRRGINISGTSSNTVIGWSPSMTNTDELFVGNRIKNNGDSGIGLTGTGVNNRFSRNQIGNNGGLGIVFSNAIGDFSVEPNDDGDVDTGENNLLNFPVIDSVYMIADDLTITGFAPAGSNIEFYITDLGINPSPLPPAYTSSFGEGAFYLESDTEGSVNDTDASSVSYTDDGTGSVISKTENRFQFTFDVTGIGLASNTPITALAIDASNNTSEFGNIEAIVIIVPEICDAQAPVISKK